MADNINLLPDQTEAVSKEAKQNALVNRVCTIILIATIIVVAGIFGAKFVLSSQLAQVEEEVMAERQVIQTKNEVEGIYRSLAGQMEAAGSFLDSQNHYSRFLTELSKTVPNGVTLTQLSTTAARDVSLTGVSSSYSDLAGFQAKLASVGGETVKFYFDKPIIASISRSSQSEPIQFTATFTINQNLLVGEVEE